MKANSEPHSLRSRVAIRDVHGLQFLEQAQKVCRSTDVASAEIQPSNDHSRANLPDGTRFLRPMNRVLKAQLSIAERHVADSEHHVARQCEIVARWSATAVTAFGQPWSYAHSSSRRPLTLHTGNGSEGAWGLT